MSIDRNAIAILSIIPYKMNDTTNFVPKDNVARMVFGKQTVYVYPEISPEMITQQKTYTKMTF
jgi:hypothetical protein